MPGGGHEFHLILEYYRNNKDVFNVDESQGYLLPRNKEHINAIDVLSGKISGCQFGSQKSWQGNQRS